jgi:hypothetical protein
MNNLFHKNFKEALSCFFIGNGGVCIPDFSKRFSFYFIVPILLLGVVFVSTAQPLIPATDTMFQRYYPDLTVFIGTPVPNQSLKKDSSALWPNDSFMVDGVLRVKYLVKEWVYGLEKPPDTIEMISYDHYGDFPFLDYEYAMLYVYKNSYGSYTQEKYRYHPVYPMLDGGWASPPIGWRSGFDTNKIVPKIMPYLDSVKIGLYIFEDSTYFPDELEDIFFTYPASYFYLNRFDVVTMYGNDIIELFNKEKGQLLESAIFHEKYVDENGAVTVPEDESIEIYEKKIRQLPKQPELAFNQFKLYKKFYNELIGGFKSNETERIHQWLLPEIRVCDSVWKKDTFLVRFLPQINERFQKFRLFDLEKVTKKEWKKWYAVSSKQYIVLKDSLGGEFNNDWIKPNLDFQNPQNELFVVESYYPKGDEQNEFFLHFVLRNGQFSLYGMHFTRMRHCYR